MLLASLVLMEAFGLGADSAASNEDGQQTIRADLKIFHLGNMLFGCASSFRMIQLLRYRLLLPPGNTSDKEEDQLLRYLATDFIDAVRKCLQEGGYAKRESEREEGGFFLVGIAGRLFCVASDYQIEEAVTGYNAIGSGDNVALGALFATQQGDLSPEQRIRIALEAAAYHTSETRPPFHIKRINNG